MADCATRLLRDIAHLRTCQAEPQAHGASFHTVPASGYGRSMSCLPQTTCGRVYAHFIACNAATSSGRMIHSKSPSPVSSVPARPTDRANHQRTGPLPLLGGS